MLKDRRSNSVPAKRVLTIAIHYYGLVLVPKTITAHRFQHKSTFIIKSSFCAAVHFSVPPVIYTFTFQFLRSMVVTFSL